MDIGFAATKSSTPVFPLRTNTNRLRSFSTWKNSIKSAITTAQTSTKSVTRTLYAKPWSFPTNTIFHPAHAGGAFLLPCICLGCRAFILPCCNTAPYKRLQRLLYHPCSLYRQRRKTAHRTLQAYFLRFSKFYRHKYQTGASGHNTAYATLKRIMAPQRLQRIPDTTATPGRCTAQHRPPYYNNVYKGAAYRKPC